MRLSPCVGGMIVRAYSGVGWRAGDVLSASEQEMMETLNMNTLAQGNCQVFSEWTCRHVGVKLKWPRPYEYLSPLGI